MDNKNVPSHTSLLGILDEIKIVAVDITSLADKLDCNLYGISTDKQKVVQSGAQASLCFQEQELAILRELQDSRAVLKDILSKF